MKDEPDPLLIHPSSFILHPFAKGDPMKSELRSVTAAVLSALAALPW
jgi:hypothetical protein